ncbi:MAG: alpha/beta fold hydrolase [Lachnospiraceae bacterium]|nr:alpha/beta fold hydrolase [Lachnospiraceae bacterium]
MQTQTYKIVSKMDELGLSVLLAMPESDVVGIVQLVHGMEEHKERYLPFMKYLCDHGYLCVIHDHRGHGGSVYSNKDYGYFYENGKEAMIEDVHQITCWVKEKYPNLPVFLFGHSMGSLIVRCYTKKYDDQIQGLIVCGSPSNRKAVGTAIFLCKTLIKLKGDHASGKMLEKIAFRSYLSGIEDIQSPNDWLSYNRANVKNYDEDPLCGNSFTLNGFLNLFLLVQETYSREGWQVKNPDLPVFFISGEDDPCMESKGAFEEAIRFMREVGYANAKAKVYPKMRHEILNEEERECVYEDVLTLLKRWA